MPDPRLSRGEVPRTGVDRTGVIGFENYVVDLVFFDHVVVADEADRLVRGVVDQAAFGAVSHAAQGNRGRVGSPQA